MPPHPGSPDNARPAALPSPKLPARRQIARHARHDASYGAPRQLQATPTCSTMLKVGGAVRFCVMAITYIAFLLLNTVGAPRPPFAGF